MPSDPEPSVTLARAESEAGEIALRRRGGVHELIVNGAFAMDTVDTSTERRLAELAVAHAARDVLVGGLGLGFTALALASAGARIEVVELAAPLVSWAYAGLTPELAAVARHPAVTLTVGDIADRLRADDPDRWDAIVLDVDNGPDFLIRAENAAVYGPDLLGRAVDQLRPDGLLLIWSERGSAALDRRLARIGEPLRWELPVVRDGHRLDYVVHGVRRR